MGCSNPHPHGQVWSMSEIPSIPSKELDAFKRYAVTGLTRDADSRVCLLCDYVRLETSGTRLVLGNTHWMAVVPWWATWPFEILCKYG